MLGQDGLEMGLVLTFGSDSEVHLFSRHLQTIFIPFLDPNLEPILAHTGTKNGQKLKLLGFQERVQDQTDFGAVF